MIKTVDGLLNKSRYFLVTFNPNNILAFGMITIESENFFSYDLLIEKIREQSPEVNRVVIINIFEFKSKQDYLSYKQNNE